jgi:tetratricopeptide (TPR) repeat protein
MRRAADETVALDLGGEGLAWYRFQLGELYFNQGDLRRAARWYGEAEQALPGYYLASAGLGKVEAARGDLEAAIARYEALVGRLPQPGFVATLGDLYALNGDPSAAQRQYDTVAFIQQLDAAQRVLYDRAVAVFFANHNIELDTALAYAESELAARQDIYAYDTLAWVLYRLGRYDEARAASDRALALGTPDAQLHYHAGLIAAAQGDAARATTHLRRALELNPHFDLLQAEEARRTLAALEK